MALIYFISNILKKIILIGCLVLTIIGSPGAPKYIPPIIEYKEPDKIIVVGKQGTKGRLIFDNVDYSVALYESTERNAQDYVDAIDSAAWFLWNNNLSPIIADHCTQGFDILYQCQIGDTCRIIHYDICQQYECVGVDRNGINTGHDLLLSSGESFFYENDPGHLYMYTCNKAGDSYHITVAIWEAVYDEEDLITIIDDDEEEDLITIIDENEEDLIPIIDNS